MIRELLDSDVYNTMGHLVRWNNRLRHESETNAVHTFYVTLYTDEICRAMLEAGERVNRAHAMSLALRHDIEEAFTGDMPRHFKSEQQTNALRQIIRREAQARLSDRDYRMWRTVQIGKSKEAQVVVIADWLAGVRYMLQEVRLGCCEILDNGILLLESDAQKIMCDCPDCAMFFDEIKSMVLTIKDSVAKRRPQRCQQT